MYHSNAITARTRSRDEPTKTADAVATVLRNRSPASRSKRAGKHSELFREGASKLKTATSPSASTDCTTWKRAVVRKGPTTGPSTPIKGKCTRTATDGSSSNVTEPLSEARLRANQCSSEKNNETKEGEKKAKTPRRQGIPLRPNPSCSFPV